MQKLKFSIKQLFLTVSLLMHQAISFLFISILGPKLGAAKSG